MSHFLKVIILVLIYSLYSNEASERGNTITKLNDNEKESFFKWLAYEPYGDIIGEREVKYNHDKKVVCYWGAWSHYRKDTGKFSFENINPKLCTHLIYGFAALHNETSGEYDQWSIKPFDPWLDLPDNYGLNGYGKVTDLRRQNKNLKVLIAIGGWNEGSEKYSIMAKDPRKRKMFVKSVIDFLEKYNFDGLDLDWEYPGQRGGSMEDKENFVHLIRELHTELHPRGYLLTAAIGASPTTIDTSYNIPMLYKYLNQVHVMAYDYHGNWDGYTGHNAPLNSNSLSDGNDQDRQFSVESTIKYLIKGGADKEKTVLGVPFYGRSFILQDSNDHALKSPSQRGASFKGPLIHMDGFLGYNEICQMISEPGNNWRLEWDQRSLVSYMYNDKKWVSFDNEKAIQEKAWYATKEGLAGIMVWSIDTDSFSREFCEKVEFSLLRIINKGLEGSLYPETPSSGRIKFTQKQLDQFITLNDKCNPSFCLISLANQVACGSKCIEDDSTEEQASEYNLGLILGIAIPLVLLFVSCMAYVCYTYAIYLPSVAQRFLRRRSRTQITNLTKVTTTPS